VDLNEKDRGHSGKPGDGMTQEGATNMSFAAMPRAMVRATVAMLGGFLAAGSAQAQIAAPDSGDTAWS